MSYSVLVATPTVAFGDLIQHTLEELGHFDVKRAYTPSEALVYAGSMQCGAAILDGDLGEPEFQLLAQQLSARCQDIRLLVFPPDNDMNHALLQGLPDPVLMRKPFYLPDLIELMNSLFERDRTENASHIMGWVDPASFDQLFSQTTARVAIVCEQGGGAEFAGHLPKGMQAELKALAQRFWLRGENSDLVRFDRLEAGQLECLLFLTAVDPGGETVLGLVFPVSTPLSKVRSQAGPLVQALRERKANAISRLAAASAKEPEAGVEGLSTDEASRAAQASAQAAAVPVPAAEVPQPLVVPASQPEEPLDWEGEEAVLINFNLAEMLGSIPSPDPNGSAEKMFAAPPGNGWLPEVMFAGSLTQTVEQAAGRKDGEDDDVLADPDVDCPVSKDEQRLRWDPEGQPEASDLAHRSDSEGDNRGNVLTSLTNLDQLEPVTGGLSLLNYTCVLIPRLPGHFLTGELSEKLAQWVQQLCLAFGWRLEGISMRPEYLQWTVQVTPAISPGNLVKIIRQRTSDYIFTQFVALRNENPSGDFWANGYLIVSGAQPPSVSLLRDYIAQTRRRQGVGRIPGDNTPRLTP